MAASNLQLNSANYSVKHAFPVGVRLTVVSTSTKSRPGKQGRPVGAQTGRELIVRSIHEALAVELQVPLRTITHYEPAAWAHCMSRLSSDVVGRVMARLAHTLPHETYGTPACIPDRELGYAAGLIDGEGCVTVVRHQRKKRPRRDMRPVFSVSQNDQQVLKRLQMTLGAHSDVHPGKKTIKTNRTPCNFIVSSAPHIIHSLCGVYELLDVKKTQVEALFRFHVEGRQWKFGRGTPPVVLKRRMYWYKRLIKMK